MRKSLTETKILQNFVNYHSIKTWRESLLLDKLPETQKTLEFMLKVHQNTFSNFLQKLLMITSKRWISLITKKMISSKTPLLTVWLLLVLKLFLMLSKTCHFKNWTKWCIATLSSQLSSDKKLKATWYISAPSVLMTHLEKTLKKLFNWSNSEAPMVDLPVTSILRW